ncbi:kinase domain protein [Ancylostoma duodenale]|uniref:non-specific serine/threonine protein kinase n=1 Tax=Ancylostoma duodenale TaxID=51022 RepID=A0A0C2GJF0_9BILA|nr:kinase domain protein [Ancylostoma duodenale]
MLSNRRSLSTRQPNGKKRVDIVYRSKWITNNFVVGDPLGAGSFGKVWTVECRKKPAQLYALKVPAPGFNPKHIAMELKVMRAISGGPNVVEFIAAYRELDRVFVVMNLFPHDDIFSLINKMSLEETLQYMRNLFIALHHIHRYRVIHRDVKPANFLYNRAQRRYLLVDFGLSHFVSSNQKRKSSMETSPSLKENVVNTTPIGPPPPVMRAISGGPNVVEFIAAYRELDRVFVVMNLFPHDDIFKRSKRLSEDILTPNRPTLIRHPKCGCTTFASVCDTCRELPIRHMNKVHFAGTPGYRAPEVLLRFEEQTTAIDVFAAGVTMLSFLLKKLVYLLSMTHDQLAFFTYHFFFLRHPVFRPSNDVEALTQMATFLGSSSLVQAAAEGGVTFLCEPPLPGMDMVKLVNNFPKDIKEAVGCKPGCRSCMALIYQNNSGFCFCKHTEADSIEKLSGDERIAFQVLTNCLNPSPSRRYTARMLADLIESPSKKSGS